jgi:octaprenyl-diphosphate synthase
MDLASTSTATSAKQETGIQPVADLCADDMSSVNELIRRSLGSSVVLIRQISEYIIGSGGKRLRPILVILASQACRYEGKDHITLAAIIEFIHTATLLHDDVVDDSDMRRGKVSAHAVWGNAASVLVGDFLYSRSFQMMVGVNSMRVMEILANTTNTIAEGEVEQLLNMHDPEVSQERYFSVIEKKTARLFEAACQLGAVLAGREDLETALATFGRELGTAFQVADDVLDYMAEAETLGKNSGDDLAEGKATLPLILCREQAGPEARKMIDESIRSGGLEHFQQITALIRDSGALDQARQIARDRADAALAAIAPLTPSPWKGAMEQLTRYSVMREF